MLSEYHKHQHIDFRPLHLVNEGFQQLNQTFQNFGITFGYYFAENMMIEMMNLLLKIDEGNLFSSKLLERQKNIFFTSWSKIICRLLSRIVDTQS